MNWTVVRMALAGALGVYTALHIVASLVIAMKLSALRVNANPFLIIRSLWAGVFILGTLLLWP